MAAEVAAEVAEMSLARSESRDSFRLSYGSM